MATYTLSGNVSSISKFLFQEAAALGATFTGQPTRDFEFNFPSSAVSKIFFATYSVTTSPTSIDVTSLTDAYGNAISFATVKHLQIVNNDGTNNLTAGGGANALLAALPPLVGQPGGSCVNLTTNLTVSGSTKIITLTSSAGTISVDLFIVGN